MLNGRLEQDNRIRQKINDRLVKLPNIFTMFYNYLEADDKSYKTCLHYISDVSDFMDYVTHGEFDEEFYKNVTTQEVRSYIASLRRRVVNGKEVKNSDSMQATKWSAINTFYNFLIMDEYTDTNPLSKTKRPKNRTQKEIVYLEKDEINQIIDKIKKEAKEQWVNRDIALVTLGITTGLRISALLNIDVSDINWQTNEITTIEKGQKTRVIKFGDKTKASLAQWIMDRNNYFGEFDTDALFISQHRKRLTHEGARKLLNKYTDGFDKHITPHCLRKSCATQAYMSGADIRTIAAQLNHNSIQTTMRYAAAVDSKKDEMIGKLDNLFE